MGSGGSQYVDRIDLMAGVERGAAEGWVHKVRAIECGLHARDSSSQCE
jgi:hypothetical protein